MTTSTEYLPGHAADWALVTAAQTGDKDAYGRLYDRHVDAVFRFIWSRIKHKQLTEDLTSETFLRALRRIDSVSYQGRGVCAWFITIAGNLIKDHIKCDTTRKVIPTEIREYDDFGQIYGVCVPLPRSPERIAVGNAAAAELLRCVAQLTDDQRQCITLRFLNDLSVTETAAAMGRNEGAVKALQCRGVRKLAELLPKEWW